MSAKSASPSGRGALNERRKLAEAIDDLGHLVDREIDFFLRIVAAQTESDRPMGRSERHAHRAEHVRGLQRTGGAGRTAAGTDAEAVEQQQNRFALDVFETDVGRVGEPALGVAVDPASRTSPEDRGFEPVA